MPKFREITGQFVGYVPDGPDTGAVPDREPMDGQVTFTPIFTGGVIAFPSLAPPEFAHPEPIRAKIVGGFVRVEVAVGDDVIIQPLSLMVTVDDEATQVWSWRADFTNMRIGSGESSVSIPSWSFRVPDGVGPIDLTEMVSIAGPSGQALAKGPRGTGLESITAVDGQLVFEYSDSQSTTVPVPEAVAGPAGVPGPAGADGSEGPEGPQGPAGEIPDLLVGNITDATPTGKNLMLAATEGAARNALGLQVGATATTGLATELNNGVSNSSRVWTPSTIAEYVTGKAQSLVDTAKTVVNVKDYGAVGDGVTDDFAAATQALEAVRDAGGGTVEFPEGTYYWPLTAQVYSNTTITGSGATFVKKPGTGYTAMFGIYSEGRTGYGSGANNVTFRNLRFLGDFAAGRQIALVGANHADDMLVEDCVFEQAHIQGHIMDLGGCRRVVVRRCVFLGQDTANSSAPTKECIQADNSTRLGTSAIDAPGSYDGLPCKDIQVVECSFLPITVGATTYPSPIPFGSHYGVQGYFHERMTFERNIVIDPPTETADVYRGIIHFAAARDITIRGNKFISTNGANIPVIRNAPLKTTLLPEEADTATSSTITLTDHVQSDDWLIEGNRFEGFKAVTSAQPIIRLSGTGGGTRVKGVTIIGNSFTDCFTPPFTTGNGPLPIEAYDVDDLVVSSNRYRSVRNAVSTGRSANVTITGNTLVTASATSAMVIGPSLRVTVTGNQLATVSTGIHITGSSQGVSVSGNTVTPLHSGVQLDAEASGGAVSGNAVIGGSSPYYISGANIIESGNATVT